MLELHILLPAEHTNLEDQRFIFCGDTLFTIHCGSAIDLMCFLYVVSVPSSPSLVKLKIYVGQGEFVNQDL